MPHQSARFCIKQNSSISAAERSCVYRTAGNAEQLQALDNSMYSEIRQTEARGGCPPQSRWGERSRNVLDALVERLERNSAPSTTSACVVCNTQCRRANERRSSSAVQ